MFRCAKLQIFLLPHKYFSVLFSTIYFSAASAATPPSSGLALDIGVPKQKNEAKLDGNRKSMYLCSR